MHKQKQNLRHCKNCDKLFVPKHGSRIYCSAECQTAHQKHTYSEKRHVAHICPCGKVFEAAETKKYCSAGCAHFFKERPKQFTV